MPYSLRGNSVVRSDTGQVVKTHPSREKALRHLRALKANVEEGSPAVLGALLEGAFDEAKHPRGFHGRWVGSELHVFHGASKITTVSASGSTSRERLLSAVQGAVRARPGRPAIDRVEAQRVVDLAAGTPPKRSEAYRGLGETPLGVGREGAAARARGASSLTTEHADTRDKLTNLPVGQRYGLHGPQGQVGHVQRTAAGWEVVGPSKPATVHKTPSSAAGAAMRIQRTAASSREQASVMMRNYRARGEVERMNARQSQMAAAKRLRAEMDRHGGFKIGDVVTHETGSRGAGGHGPVTFTKQPGMSTVVGLQRNGNLRLKHPATGTTHDVHHSHAQKVSPLHPDYRGKVVQDAYAAQKAELARQKAARARKLNEAGPGVLGALLSERQSA